MVYPKCFRNRTIIDDAGFPKYRRMDNDTTVTKNDCVLDNTFIVPYNPKLLLKYGCHLNVEYTCQTSLIKYLFKYIHKGNDRVTAALFGAHPSNPYNQVVDEIQNYYDCRYISSCEAAWRLYGFQIQSKEPVVLRLSFHLPDEQPVVYKDDENIQQVLEKASLKNSMFLGWMEANKIYEEAKNLTYTDFPTVFVWKKCCGQWMPRKIGFSIERVTHVPVGSGEDYYLRLLLHIQKGCMDFKDITTVDGITYNRFKDACYALGLLQDDREFIQAIHEASSWASAHYIRKLFVILLISNSIARPEFVWEKCWKQLSEDILYNQRRLLDFQDLVLSDDELKNLTLVKIDEMLQSNGRRLTEFPPLPVPSQESLISMDDRLILEEMNFDRDSLKIHLAKSLKCMTDEQRYAYDTILQVVHDNK